MLCLFVFSCSVIATVGSAEKAQLAKKAGADHVINYNEVEFQPEVRKLTNGVGVNVVFGQWMKRQQRQRAPYASDNQIMF